MKMWVTDGDNGSMLIWGDLEYRGRRCVVVFMASEG